MNRRLLAAVTITLFLSGCGGSAVVPVRMDRANQQKLAADKMTVADVTSSVKGVPAHFLTNVKGHLEAALIERGLLAVKDPDHANKVEINITYYRMRGRFARSMFGIFAGRDGIDGEVIIVDPSGDRITTLDASSFNLSAGGGPDYIAREFAQQVVSTLEKHIAR